MKVLMFGWEFPPFKSGGLGTACFHLTKSMANKNIDVTFVMPKAPENAKAKFVNLIGTNKFKIKIKKVNTVLTPYMSEKNYKESYNEIKATTSSDVYGYNLYHEVERFNKAAAIIAREEDHDIIHVHDWMTYGAGIRAKEISGKPLVAHIHATEFDRTGGNPNNFISHIEYKGLQKADMVITNSKFMKENLIKFYSVDADKIKIVYWGVEQENPCYNLNYRSPLNKENIVLFLGRITIQKGPDYFVEAANKVLNFLPNTKFIVAGSGDMLPRMINRAAELGISDKFIFTGFLKGDDVHKAFQMADLYVMPSVSEPFGLVALEAMRNNTPTIISKQSGVSEVVKNALKVDFWDVDEITNKIVGVLQYKELQDELRDNGYEEACKMDWDKPAQECIDIYKEVLRW